MLQMEVIASDSSPWYRVYHGGIGTLPDYTADSRYWDEKAYSVMLQPFPSSIVRQVYADEVGSLVQGTERFGTMRDRPVRHYNTDATFTVNESQPLSRTIVAVPEFRQTDGSWLKATAGTLKWGSSGAYSKTLPQYDYYMSGWRTVSACTLTAEWFYSGDKACLVINVDYPKVTVRDTTTVISPAFKRSVMTAFRRELSTKSLFQLGSRNNFSDHSSEGNAMAYLYEFTGLTGTKVDPVGLTQQAIGNTDLLWQSFKTGVEHLVGAVSLDLLEHPADFGDLGLECSKQLRYVDQNVLLLVLDIDDWRHFREMWKSFANTKAWKRAKYAFLRLWDGKSRKVSDDLAALFKPGTSTYIFTKYAVLPTISDCQRLLSGALKFSSFLRKQRLHSRRITSLSDPTKGVISATHTAVLTVKCALFPTWFTGRVTALIAELDRWGAYPKLQNLWDILPYSFVVDWFVQFGDLFEDTDNYLNQLQYFPIEYCVMSEKWEKTVLITSVRPDFPVPVEVKLSYYVRWCSTELPLPTVSLEAESLIGKHLLESTALILQRHR